MKMPTKTLLSILILFSSFQAFAVGVMRYPLPNDSKFPIALGVEVASDYSTIYMSGTIPSPANNTAEKNSRDYWGDTEAQAHSVFKKISASLKGQGLIMGDVVKMTVFLVGDPKLGGRMDFEGFMSAYVSYFGTDNQLNLPARSVVEISGLVAPGMLVEIEVIAVRQK